MTHSLSPFLIQLSSFTFSDSFITSLCLCSSVTRHLFLIYLHFLHFPFSPLVVLLPLILSPSSLPSLRFFTINMSLTPFPLLSLPLLRLSFTPSSSLPSLPPVLLPSLPSPSFPLPCLSNPPLFSLPLYPSLLSHFFHPPPRRSCQA